MINCKWKKLKKSIRIETTGLETNPLIIVQETEIWQLYQMIYAQTRNCPREWDTKFSEILKYKQIT